MTTFALPVAVGFCCHSFLSFSHLINCLYLKPHVFLGLLSLYSPPYYWRLAGDSASGCVGA